MWWLMRPWSSFCGALHGTRLVEATQVFLMCVPVDAIETDADERNGVEDEYGGEVDERKVFWNFRIEGCRIGMSGHVHEGKKEARHHGPQPEGGLVHETARGEEEPFRAPSRPQLTVLDHIGQHR